MMSLKIAFRNIFRQKRRSFLSGLAILGGFVLLSFSQSMKKGSYEGMIRMFTADKTGHVQIHRKGYLDRPSLNKAIGGLDALYKVIATVPGVTSFAPRVLGPALGYGNNKTTPVQVMGIDLERELKTTRLRDKLKQGRFLEQVPNSQGVHGALIGAGILENLKVKLGDELVLISQGADGSVANERFEITGVIGTKESQDQSTVYLSLQAAQNFYFLPEGAHEIAILLSDFSHSSKTAVELQKALDQAGIASSLSVEPWEKVEAEFYQAMQNDKKGQIVSSGIILFIVAMGVLNVVLMMILERTREYGVLKAIGTQPGQVFGLIVLETALLALMSVGIGLLIALPLNYHFQENGILLSVPMEMGGISYDRIVASVSVSTILGPAFLVIISAIIISIFPAWRATRIQVVDALRSI